MANANSILILGSSGSGKSYSCLNLDHKKTMLINVYGKALPFRGWKKKYTTGTGGNMANTDNAKGIIASIDYAVNQGFEIIVIDDYQFVGGFKMIRESLKKESNPYAKFTRIANDFVAISDHVKAIKKDVTVFFLSHVEEDGFGGTKAKTAGKMVDNIIGFESLYTVVLQTKIIEGVFGFTTVNDGSNTVKAPVGMFDGEHIPNDLDYVNKCVIAYDNDEDAPSMPVMGVKTSSVDTTHKVHKKTTKSDSAKAPVDDIPTTEVKAEGIPPTLTGDEKIVVGKIEEAGGNTSIGIEEIIPTSATPEKVKEIPEEKKETPPVKSFTKDAKEKSGGVPSVDIEEIHTEVSGDNSESEIDPKVNQKAIDLAEFLGGWVKTVKFLRFKHALGKDENLKEMEDFRIDRLIANKESLKAVMDKGGWDV